MMRPTWYRSSFAMLFMLAVGGSATLLADRLVLRDGQVVQGRLVGIRDNVVEFEERRGFFGTTVRRFDRAEVRSIEFDESSRLGTAGGGSGSGTPSRPGGLREREIAVAAESPWTDTGVNLRGGQVVYFSATGRVRWGPDRRDGPAGERNSPRNPARPIPSRPAAALIGRIGEDSTDVFFIGDEQGPIRTPAPGRLFLGINDDFLQDNSGSFQVTVYY